MNTRLKIDLNQGIIEVEGTETFVKTIFEEFKSGSFPKISGKLGNIDNGLERKHPLPKTGTKESHSQRRKPTSYLIVKDLDLSGKKGKQSLRDFFKLKSPSSNMENSAVFVYYLEKIAGLRSINQNHVYSCYKDVKIKIPNALRQSLLDTAFHKGWIDTSNMDDLKIATPGENFVEHDLPKKKEK